MAQKTEVADRPPFVSRSDRTFGRSLVESRDLNIENRVLGGRGYIMVCLYQDILAICYSSPPPIVRFGGSSAKVDMASGKVMIHLLP